MRNVSLNRSCQIIEISRCVDEQIYMGNVLSRPHPDECSRATFAECTSCIIMQNGLIERLMSHRQPRRLPFIRVQSRIIFLFPSATINTTVRIIRLPVFHASWHDASRWRWHGAARFVTRLQDSPHDPVKRSRDAGGVNIVIARVITRIFFISAANNPNGEWMLSAARFLFTVTDTGEIGC